LAAVLNTSSAVILLYGTKDQQSSYAAFKKLQKTDILVYYSLTGQTHIHNCHLTGLDQSATGT